MTWRRLDHLQPLVIGMLAMLGIMTVFSADADWGRQVVWMILGAVAYVAATAFDYRRLRPLALGLYGGMMLLLLAVHLCRHQLTVVLGGQHRSIEVISHGQYDGQR